MLELEKWILLIIITFIFLVFGVNENQGTPQLTYIGVGIIFVLIVAAILLTIFQKGNDT
jgi:hypothetical protein